MAYKQQKCISHSSEILKPEIRVSAQLGEVPFQVSDFLHPHMVGRSRELYGSLCKDATLFHEGSPSQGPYFLMPSPQRLGFQHKNWEGGANIQLIAVVVFPQIYTCIKNLKIVHLKYVQFIVNQLDLNKT